MSVIPAFETVALFRTQAGTRHLVRNLGSIGRADSVTLGVSSSGLRLTLLVNGSTRAVLTDDRLADEHGAGLAAMPSTTLGHGRWRDFTVTRPATPPETESLRRNPPVDIETLTTPFRWPETVGRWSVGPGGARLIGHGRSPADLALVPGPPGDTTITVTLTGIR